MTQPKPTTATCPTLLIPDAPATEDRFGSHARVATALAELVASKQSGGKMIGVQGGWGSGKSTVINLLSHLLQENSDTTLFRFDAWAHHNDPLRRTYLESLIKHIIDKKWLSDTKGRSWERALLEISRRYRETETHTKTVPSAFGKLAAFSALLIPVGLTFLNQGLENGVSLELSRSPNWYFIWGLVLSLAPAWLTLYFKARDRQGFDFALFDAKAEETVRSTTIETADPTSLEFEERFNGLMNDALRDHPDRSVVIVLDNLDRVDAEDFQAVWTTLQTFLQHRGTTDQPWHSQIRFLVPFDLNGIHKLWPNDVAAADSFLNKSFQTRFEVPPLLLSNWKTYLLDLLREAMPSHKDEELLQVYHVLSRCWRGTPSPTPRELILYVNRVGTIHRQWQDHTFPFDHVAYYVYLRGRHDNGVFYSGLLAASFPLNDDASLFTSVTDLRRNLAGLFFNVVPDKGMEIVLGNPIFNALSSGNEAELKDLEQKHGAAFGDVLEQVSLDRFIGADANDLANAAACIEAAGTLGRFSTYISSIVVRKLTQAAVSSTTWDVLKHTGGAAAICRMAPTPTISASLVDRLRDSLVTQQNQFNLDQAKSAVSGLSAVLIAAAASGHGETAPFALPVEVGTWIALCPEIGTLAHQPYAPLMQPKDGYGRVREALTNAATEGKWSDVHRRAVAATEVCFPRGDWNPLVGAIFTRLSRVDQTDSPAPSRMSQL